MDTVKHRFSLPSDPTAAERARRALDAIEDLLEPRILDARLLVTELVAISLNSRPLDRGGIIGLGIELSGTAIRIDVTDDADVVDRVSVLFNGPIDRVKLIDEIADSWGLVDTDEHSMWCMLERASPDV